MSTINDATATVTCANCGKGEERAGSLKSCTACKTVKYCNRDCCQVAHRPQHKKACKKRAAELHDIELFKQPPPPEDCPICMLRLPTLLSGSKYNSCCGKMVCTGCDYAVAIRDVVEQKCPFCRTPAPESKDVIQRAEKRVALGDAQAIYSLGCYYDNGSFGLSQSRAKALELWNRAAKMGCSKAFFSIGVAFDDGTIICNEKAIHCYELAAMGGDSQARYNLGGFELAKGNFDRALKHFILAARGGDGGGDDDSLIRIQEMFKEGVATKEDYTQALRAYQAYLGEIKSPQRDEAALNDSFKYF